MLKQSTAAKQSRQFCKSNTINTISLHRKFRCTVPQG